MKLKLLIDPIFVLFDLEQESLILILLKHTTESLKPRILCFFFCWSKIHHNLSSNQLIFLVISLMQSLDIYTYLYE